MALTKLLYGYLHGMSRDFFVRFSTKSCRLWKNPLFRGDISVENPQRGALTGALRSGSPAGSWHPTKSFDFAGTPHSIQPGRQSPPGSRFCPRQNAWTRHLARSPYWGFTIRFTSRFLAPHEIFRFRGAPHSIQPGRQSPPGSRFCPRQNAWTRHLARNPY